MEVLTRRVVLSALMLAHAGSVPPPPSLLPWPSSPTTTTPGPSARVTALAPGSALERAHGKKKKIPGRREPLPTGQSRTASHSGLLMGVFFFFPSPPRCQCGPASATLTDVEAKGARSSFSILNHRRGKRAHSVQHRSNKQTWSAGGKDTQASLHSARQAVRNTSEWLLSLQVSRVMKII